MLPFLPLVSFAALAMGMLNAQGRFAVPAAAPAMFNVVSIVWAAGLWAMGFGPVQVVDRDGRSAPCSAAPRSSSSRCRRCGATAGVTGRSGSPAIPASAPSAA